MYRLIQILKNLILFCLLSSFLPHNGFSRTSIMGFNWGDRDGVKNAIEALKIDDLETPNGFEIGPIFWKSLFQSQAFSDHNAGDGLYFSTQPLDSSRFGPSLLIVEIEISDPHNEKLLKAMTGEQAQVHPELLPTIVRYRGSWHVIKSLPKDERVKIWVRKPKKSDVDKIFINFELDQNKTKALDLITEVASRYAYHFRRFEKTGLIPEDKRANSSTQKFMSYFILQLVERGLKFRSSNFATEVDARLFSGQLTHTLNTLRQVDNEKAIYGFDMTKTIYKKMLSQPIDWPPEVIRILRFYNNDYFNKFSQKPNYQIACLALF